MLGGGRANWGMGNISVPLQGRTLNSLRLPGVDFFGKIGRTAFQVLEQECNRKIGMT